MPNGFDGLCRLMKLFNQRDPQAGDVYIIVNVQASSGESAGVGSHWLEQSSDHVGKYADENWSGLNLSNMAERYWTKRMVFGRSGYQPGTHQSP